MQGKETEGQRDNRRTRGRKGKVRTVLPINRPPRPRIRTCTTAVSGGTALEQAATALASFVDAIPNAERKRGSQGRGRCCSSGHMSVDRCEMAHAGTCSLTPVHVATRRTARREAFTTPWNEHSCSLSAKSHTVHPCSVGESCTGKTRRPERAPRGRRYLDWTKILSRATFNMKICARFILLRAQPRRRPCAARLLRKVIGHLVAGIAHGASCAGAAPWCVRARAPVAVPTRCAGASPLGAGHRIQAVSQARPEPRDSEPGHMIASRAKPRARTLRKVPLQCPHERLVRSLARSARLLPSAIAY